MPSHRRLLATGAGAGVALLVSAFAPAIGMSTYTPAAAPHQRLQAHTPAASDSAQRLANPKVGRAPRATAPKVPAEPATPLTVTIDELPSIGITRGEPVKVSGQVSNPDDLRWGDAQVYLTMSAEPATSKVGLDEFALIEGGFGTPVETIGLFDEIGALLPGDKKPYSLSVPFRYLPINQTAGVYHVGVIVLASNREGRDADADARADTLLPLLPNRIGETTIESTTTSPPAQTPDSSSSTATNTDSLKPTKLLSLVPLSAPVSRHSDGAFVDDTLATLVSGGGRLRNVLNFALAAPAQTLELVVDPAILQACQDMAAGYAIRSGKDLSSDTVEGDPGSQRAAAAWIADLKGLAESQGVTLLPWGSPASSALVDSDLTAVIEAAVLAGKTYAAEANLSAAITDWPNNGLASRRGLAVTRSKGASVQIVSQLSLPNLRGDALAPDAYPPAQVTLGTVDGPLKALVTRQDIGGVAFKPDVDILELRQAVAAEATVRALSSQGGQTSVLAAPLYWNPTDSAGADFRPLYDFPTVSATNLGDAETITTANYAGPVRLPRTATPAFPAEMVEAIDRLQNTGQVFVELLTDERRLPLEFYRELANAGSYWGQRHPNRATSLIRSSKRQKSSQINKVTIAGPSFVTLSSESGRFPLTVTNGLDTTITVRINVLPRDETLRIEQIEPIKIEPGRQRDVEIVSRATGSGLTAVTARLATASERPFGRPVAFDIRATQIGLAIWVVFGIAAAVIIVASGLRIYRRIRTTGFRRRGELPT